MFASASIRLATRVSVALLKFSKPARSTHRYVPLSPNGLTRSFTLSSRVTYAPEQTKINPQEDNQETKPKKAEKTKKATTSKAKKPGPKATKSEKPQKPKPKPITADMLPPTGPATPYTRFVKDWYSKQPQVQSKGEMTSHSKVIAAEWHALSESEKQPYYESYHAERDVFLKKRQEWFDSIEPGVLKQLNKARKDKGKRALRNHNSKPSDKPLGPFMQFLEEHRLKQDEKLPVQEMGRRGGEAWRALTNTERQHYYDRYKNEMDEWRVRNANATAESA